MATDIPPSVTGAPAGLPRIAVLMGDPNGVGPELAVKLLQLPEVHQRARIVVVAPPAVWEAGQRDAGAALDLEVRGQPLPEVGQRVSVKVDTAALNVLRR